jgi:hypothetical protein
MYDARYKDDSAQEEKRNSELYIDIQGKYSIITNTFQSHYPYLGMFVA